MRKKLVRRCGWAQGDPLEKDDLMRRYHDVEWGVPLHDDRRLFESIILDGAQAGLSWRTILLRREGYRRAFHRFDASKIARYGSKDVRRLLNDPGIIRNRAKVKSAIQNARAFLNVQKEFKTFDRYIWSFVKGKPKRIKSRPHHYRQLPVTSPEAEAMSQDLRGRGFSFVGPTICYAFMQATGMVDDHLRGCFRTKK